MENLRLDIIRDERSRKKFCALLDKDFNCSKAFGCGLSCPLALCWLVTSLVDDKRLSIGQAYRLSVRESVDYKQAVDILREAIEGKAQYPTKDLKQVKDAARKEE